MTKILISLIFGFSIFYLSSCATQDEASAAFQGLSELIAGLADKLTADIDNTIQLINDQLETTELELFASIIAKANETERRINEISDKVLSAGVDPSRCVQGLLTQVEQFRSRLTERARSCVILSANIVPIIAEEAWTDAMTLESDIMACHAISLAQCVEYSNSDGCYDFFISNIDRASENMAINFGLVKANFVSRVTGLRLPCRDVIDFEMIHYPSFLVKAASSCIEVEIRNSIPITCNNEVE